MAVRCPDCGREHRYTAPAYPCACGAPVAPALNHRAAAIAVTHHTWDEDWVTVHCGTCGRADQWPQPELGCSCGTVLRVPVAGSLRPLGPGGTGGPAGASGRPGARGSAPTPSAPRSSRSR